MKRRMNEHLKIHRGKMKKVAVDIRTIERISGGYDFDGMDVETWARDRLVDIFFLGNRSLEVDIDGFRRITAIASDAYTTAAVRTSHQTMGIIHTLQGIATSPGGPSKK